MEELVCEVSNCNNSSYKNRKFCKACLDKLREKAGFFDRAERLSVREQKDRPVERRGDATHEGDYSEESDGDER